VPLQRRSVLPPDGGCGTIAGMPSGAVDRRPPDALVRLVSPVLRWILRSPAGRALPKLAVLEFTGRRTGRRYSVVTGWYHVREEQLVVTPARWRANFEQEWPLAITNSGTRLRGYGRLEAEPSVVADVIRQLLGTGTTARGLGMAMPDGHVFDESDVAATRKAIVRFLPE